MTVQDDMTESPEQAARLNRLLDAAPTATVPPALERRILADFDRLAARPTFAKLIRRIADAVWPDAPLWQPAAAFGAALLAGLSVAVFAPFDIPQQDDASASVFALDSSPDVDAGQDI